jgi:hypothetical protein
MLVDDGARERMRERRRAYERGELVGSENDYNPIFGVVR